jgi:hypothetical protein
VALMLMVGGAASPWYAARPLSVVMLFLAESEGLRAFQVPLAVEVGRQPAGVSRVPRRPQFMLLFRRGQLHGQQPTPHVLPDTVHCHCLPRSRGAAACVRGYPRAALVHGTFMSSRGGK